jgi:hypothetical protein
MICRRCKCEFSASKPRVFCGRKCKADASRKIDLTKLAELAADGNKGTYMAAVLNVSEPTVLRALLAHGLYDRWTERRNA